MRKRSRDLQNARRALGYALGRLELADQVEELNRGTSLEAVAEAARELLGLVETSADQEHTRRELAELRGRVARHTGAPVFDPNDATRNRMTRLGFTPDEIAEHVAELDQARAPAPAPASKLVTAAPGRLRRAPCHVCGDSVPVCTDGGLRAHGDVNGGNPCPGSGCVVRCVECGEPCRNVAEVAHLFQRGGCERCKPAPLCDANADFLRTNRHGDVMSTPGKIGRVVKIDGLRPADLPFEAIDAEGQAFRRFARKRDALQAVCERWNDGVRVAPTEQRWRDELEELKGNTAACVVLRGLASNGAPLVDSERDAAWYRLLDGLGLVAYGRITDRGRIMAARLAPVAPVEKPVPAPGPVVLEVPTADWCDEADATHQCERCGAWLQERGRHFAVGTAICPGDVDEIRELNPATAHRRVALVSCGRAKVRDGGEHPARELYNGGLFTMVRREVEKRAELGELGGWFILSALHGLVDPDDWLRAYDHELSRAKADAWGVAVAESLLPHLQPGDTVEIHAGKTYAPSSLVQALDAAGVRVEYVAKGLQIGERRGLYAERWTQLASS